MKSTRFVSPNFPERVAEPESPFHPDYLAHRRNLIRLAATVNEELSTTVETLNREFVHQTEEIHLRYSNALATAGLSRAELASSMHSTRPWKDTIFSGRCVQRSENEFGVPWNLAPWQ
jgi:hypothetical protein